MQGQLISVDEAASVLGDRSGDRLAFSAWVEAVADPADAQEVPMDAIEELGEAFSEDLDDAFVDTGMHPSGDALEDVFVDALDAEDAGDYFAQVLRGIQSAARSPARLGIPPDLLRRFAGLLQRYRAQRFDEMEAAEDLADQFSEEGTDEAASLVGGLLARALARPSARRPPRPMSRPLRRQLVRNTRQAAQTLVRRQGPRAIRALPPIARSVQRTVVRQRRPVRALPSAVRNVTNRVARTPALAQSLSRTAQLREPVVPPYTQCDFIDPRIDVYAQYALYDMLKSDMPTRRAAVGMLAAVKAGQLGGIYQEDQRVPAMRARRLGLGWWGPLMSRGQPQGQPAVCILEPRSDPPIIVFRRSIRSDRFRLGQALRAAWLACGLPNLPPPPPSGKPCSRPPPPPQAVPPQAVPPQAVPPPPSTDWPPPTQPPVCAIVGRSGVIESNHTKWVPVKGIGVHGSFRTNAEAQILPSEPGVPCTLRVEASIRTAIADQVSGFGSFVAIVNGVAQRRTALVRRQAVIADPMTIYLGEGSIILPAGEIRNLQVNITTGYRLSTAGGTRVESAEDSITLL